MLRRLPLLIATILIYTMISGSACATELTQAERRAVEILGPGKVLGYRDVCLVQQAKLPDVEPTMPFSENILRECAKANAQGANWRLAYVTGRSLRQEREVMGWNQKKPPCFDPDLTWWLNKAEDPWAIRAIKPGYCLLDFTKRFSSLDWESQTSEIAKLGPNYERAEEQAVTEVCFSNFLLSPSKERFMENWYHWGRLQTSIGGSVCVGYFSIGDCVGVGYFGQHGFHVSYRWDLGWVGDSRDDLGVVLARKS